MKNLERLRADLEEAAIRYAMTGDGAAMESLARELAIEVAREAETVSERPLGYALERQAA